jgi:hypothetical protein
MKLKKRTQLKLAAVFAGVVAFPETERSTTSSHEITHTLTAQAAGWVDYYRLPQWVREGYADYVGKCHRAESAVDAPHASGVPVPPKERRD